MKYQFTIKDLKYTETDGFPEDEEICFAVWKNKDGDFDCFIGAYNANKKCFYADFGFGGLILKADTVIAWKPFNCDNILIKRQ